MKLRILGMFALSFAASAAVTVGNHDVDLTFDLDHGVTLTGIRNNTTRVQHLAKPSALFEVAAKGVTVSSDSIVIDDSTRSKDGSKLTILAHSTTLPLKFAIDVTMPEREPVALLRVTMTNTGWERLLVRGTIPKLGELVTGGPASRRMGMVPAEIGNVIPMPDASTPAPPIGMRLSPKSGLPTGMNSMEVASVFDAGGKGGVFFADVDGDLDNGVAPLQFALSAAGVAAYWPADLEPGQTRASSRFAIGVHASGDWHVAVDYYVAQHRPRWTFEKVPAWFRDQGAIYSYTGSGSGGIYMQFPRQNLRARIGSFDNLTQLLDESQAYGTNVVFIADYWEGPPGREYGNKGDYIPRSDMGGGEAFKKGIRAMHERGGKLIVYVEPFIINFNSNIGKEKGEAWAGRDALGHPYSHYANNYSMVPSQVAWQDFMVKTAERLVKDYDVDGIFLDSFAWQMNWPMTTQEDNVYHSPTQYSQGVLTTAGRVLKAVQAIKPDAVVMGETTAGPIARHWHGGLSADFAWMEPQNQGRIAASPVRYGVPEVNFITNGRNVNEINQVFAAGHNLAICNGHAAWTSYIKKLVGIRQEYKDALIYGAQAYQPSAENPEIVAYYYKGSAHEMIMAVNMASQQSDAAKLTLRKSEANSKWKDLLTGDVFKTSGNQLTVEIPGTGLRVLVRE